MKMKRLVAASLFMTTTLANAGTLSQDASYLDGLKRKHDFNQSMIEIKEQEVKDLSVSLQKAKEVAKISTGVAATGLVATGFAAGIGLGLGLAGSGVGSTMFFLSMPAEGVQLVFTGAVVSVGAAVAGLPATYASNSLANFLATAPSSRDVKQAQILSGLVQLADLKKADGEVDLAESDDQGLEDSVENSLTLGWHDVSVIQKMINRDQQHIEIYKQMNSVIGLISEKI